MLDLFTIFSKGGIALWCFQSTSQIFTPSVNALIRSVILQERTGVMSYDHDSLRLQYKLDNEFDLVFVVAYQKILKLSYIDKLLSDVHLEFRDKYKNQLKNQQWIYDYNSFNDSYKNILTSAEQWGLQQAKMPKQMRTFDESAKSKKTVGSMIERKDDKDDNKKGKKKKIPAIVDDNSIEKGSPKSEKNADTFDSNGDAEMDIIQLNKLKLAEKLKAGQKKKIKSQKSPKVERTGKEPRVWEFGGTNKDLANLERTKDKPSDADDRIQANTALIGQMKGEIHDLEVESDSDDDDYNYDDTPIMKKETQQKKVSGGGMFSVLKGLVSSKSLTSNDLEPALEKMKDLLIAKNVASDISISLCNSVRTKLEGKILGTFQSVASTVKTTLEDSLVQILSPKRRVDILRDAYEAKKNNKPYVMSFCGVNGVGKSTNLAKICFWLIENNFRVLIAACDTFRAGAVEQLRTHTRHLNALHPAEKHGNQTMVQLFEKGYGKDAAGIAMEAIRFAKDSRIDIVLIDTAGRMQDNEPLMRALAKLIKVNEPDLVLFVGEALVGNEAVDQLVKFNRALEDYSNSTNPRTIDGIVLTKFDTIDDKVGAAISMTYITGQPIVFVGTGQTYTDLKTLNAKAVVHALMK